MNTRSWITIPFLMVGLLGGPVPGSAQGSGEAVMIAAGRWASDRLPGGSVRVDPHRTGRDAGQAVARRLAAALRAELGTVEEMRRCEDELDPSTCELGCDVLLAVATPGVDGDDASVRVYVWHRSDDPRSPVARSAWDLTLRRSGGGWAVVKADLRP